MSHAASRWSGALLFVSALAAAPFARAESNVSACVAAHARGQAQRDKGELRAARASFVECAHDSCPAMIRKDCSPWLEDVESALPSIVVEALDADGQETSDVRVSVEGVVLAPTLTGLAIAADPGPHVFVFEHDGVRVEARILIREGEKRRPIRVSLVPKVQATAPIESHEVLSSSAWTLPIPAYVLGGVAAAGLLSFGTFSILGLAKEGDLSSCKPHCTNDDVAPLKRDYAVGDISLAVGLVSLGAAVYFAWPRLSRSVAFRVTPGGAAFLGAF